MSSTPAAPRGSDLPRAAALAFALCAGAALAQSTDDNLTSTQRLGRQLFAQSCSICHLPPVRNSATYGPVLSRNAAQGNEDLMRSFITNGTARMPAFKYHLKNHEIDAVVAFLRTVPPPAARGEAQ